MPLKITLITGSHLSSNPRLVKEAKALLTAGYELDILCAQNIESLSKFDEEIFAELSKARIHIIDYQDNTLKGKYLRLKSATRLKLARYLKDIPRFKLISQCRMLPEMKSALKRVKADLYIAHTIAGLPAAAWAANYHNSLYAFDAEDYHSGETNDLTEQRLTIGFENRFFNNCSYISTASPLSTELYKQRYPHLKIITINNVFPFSDLHLQPFLITTPLKIVWFSQTIGLDRGLQAFIKALSPLKANSYELHLRGSYNDEIKTELLSYSTEEWKSSIFFYPQCSSVYLDEWLKQFDIGLALEEARDLNREICISNKIFQYISTGLAVIASETEGQKWVLKQAPAMGVIIRQGEMKLAADQLAYWSENPTELQLAKENSLMAAQTIFNWDLEKDKLLAEISIISNRE